MKTVFFAVPYQIRFRKYESNFSPLLFYSFANSEGTSLFPRPCSFKHTASTYAHCVFPWIWKQCDKMHTHTHTHTHRYTHSITHTVDHKPYIRYVQAHYFISQLIFVISHRLSSPYEVRG